MKSHIKVNFRLLINVVLIFLILTGTNQHLRPKVVKAQTVPTYVSQYMEPSENATEMISVNLDGRIFELFIVGTHSRNFENYFYDTKRVIDETDWANWGYHAVLVFDESHQLVTNPDLLKKIFQSQIGGYLSTQDQYAYSLVPGDDDIIHDYTTLTQSLGFKTAFIAQELDDLFQLKTDTDRYAEAFRALLAQDDPLVIEFTKNVVNDVTSMGMDFQDAISNRIKVDKFSNHKYIREAAKRLEKEFNTKWKATGGEYTIDSYKVEFANYIEFGTFLMNLALMQELSVERGEMLAGIAQRARNGEIQLSNDVLSAIQVVLNEVNDPINQRLDYVYDFLREQSGRLISTIAQKEFQNWIWDTFGKRTTGHLVAKAFSLVGLSYSIANLLFGMDAIYQNFLIAEFAGKFTEQIESNLRNIRQQRISSQPTYPSSAAAYRELAIWWNLALAQSYRSRAEAVLASRVLNIVMSWTSDEWEKATQGLIDFAVEGEILTYETLIRPEIIEYAISQIALRKAKQPISSVSSSSSTVLVLDTSGSMNEADVSGRSKLQAAQAAATNILDVIAAEVQSGTGQGSQVGLVDFNAGSTIDSPLSTDINAVRNSLQSLYANGGTGMADGLQNGLSLFANQSTTVKQMIILLSDGNPNIPLSGGAYYDLTAIQQEVLDLAAQAGDRGICVYTIGFGVPNTQGTLSLGDASIDEDFLRRVAEASRCGAYYNAQNASQLANVFVELRHTSMGSVIFQQSGQISQDQQIDLGNVTVPTNQELLLLTLNWPGSKLEPVLKDPTGVVVDQNYPGATISSTSTLVSIVLSNPKAGDWNFSVIGVDVPEGTTVYNTLISTRAGTTILPPQGSGSFPIVILILVIFGGGIGVYVYSRSIQRTGRRSAAATPGTQLVGTYGTAAGQTINLYDGLIIGRGSASGLRLNDPSVSRAHASLRFAQGAWFIQDLGSKSGIIVNGQKVSATRLNPGDQIQIGGSAFIFKSGGK